MTSGDERIDALLGQRGMLTTVDITLGTIAAIAISAFVLAQRSKLVLRLVSPEIARTTGIDVAKLDLWFLLAFALTVALGLHYLVVLLMGSMIIIPAATAKRLARTLPQMLAYAVGVAVLATVVGTELAGHISRPSGPVIICTAAVLFAVTLVKRPR